jgi:acyl-CoA hydrolase
MRRISFEQLKTVLKDLPDNPRVVVSGNFAMPKALMSAFDAEVPKYRLHMLNAQVGIPHREGVSYESAFIGRGMRNSKQLTYIPSRLSLLPVLIKSHLKPDIVLIHTSLPRFDTVSLGTEVNILPAAIESVRANGGLVIAQANSHMPYTYGDAQIYEHEIDFLIESDEALTEHVSGPLTPIGRAIGERIAPMIKDNSTLQLGIGAVPDATLELLKARNGMRIWTETFSDGVLNMEEASALDEGVPITASFVFGSKRLYEWLHLNRRIRMFRTEKTNDPSQIGKQARMTSINAALQVDLYDQANASRVRGTIYSGFGGSTDFITGALHSTGGQSFMALPSWHAKSNTSTIIPLIDGAVTSFQHSHVVTENGIARCFGMSEREQAENIIEFAAHPDARAELTKTAQQMGLLC